MHSYRTAIPRLIAVIVFVTAANPGRGAAAPTSPAPAGLPNVTLPEHLTLADTMQLFRSNGLDLLIADAAVASAQGDLRIARAVANPSISGGLAHSFAYDPTQCPDATCSATAWSASVSDQAALSDEIFGKRKLRIKVAEAALLAARQGRRDAERTIAASVKQQYLAVELGQAGVSFARESAASTAETLRLVQVRCQAGAVSQADVARAQTASLEAEQMLDRAVQDLQQARAGLAFLLGVRGPVPEFEAADELLRPTVPAGLANPDSAALLATARQRRPDLAAALAQRTRAERGLALAERQRIPAIQLEGSYSQEGSGQSAIQPPTFGVSLSLAVPLFYNSQGEIAKAQADLRTQDLQWAKLEAQVRSDVATAVATFTGARRRAERMDTRLLDSARLARDLVRFQYQKGAASLLEMLDAERTLIATEVERLQVLNDYWSALFAVEAATGMELVS